MEEMLQFETREDKHQIKKRAVYEELACKFSEANFHISWEAVQKKWQNLMSTYWRNLKKPKKDPQWEYFKEMDVILRNTSVWVGLNGCKDPKQRNSLHYNDQTEDRLWNNERIIFLLDEMRQLCKDGDARGRRSVFHRISTNFQRIGVDFNWKVIQKKWHNLMTTYKRNLSKPRNEVAWELFDMIDNILNKTSSQQPVNCDETSHLSMSPPHQTTEDKATEDDDLWTHDNTLWLLEEMMAVKERRDKHLLKNRVVFREIADTFNEENFMVDWKKVLRKWQTMYVVYSKIYRGIMQPTQWQYFERMHDIVGDTDMYVGIGNVTSSDNNSMNSKNEREDPLLPTETVYHYINPDDNSQFIMTCSEALNSSDNNVQFTCKPLVDSRLAFDEREQFVELSPEFVTTDYVAVPQGTVSPVSAVDHKPELTVEFTAVEDDGELCSIGLVGSKPIINNSLVKGRSIKRPRYQLKNGDNSSNNLSVNRRDILTPALNGTNNKEDSPRQKRKSIDSEINNETHLIGSDDDIVQQTVVLEDGVVFEEHLDLENGECVPKEEQIEVNEMEFIEVECDGAVSNSVDEEGEDPDNLVVEIETAFEISEMPEGEDSANSFGGDGEVHFSQVWEES
ncbi:uncharacterized protein LOC108677664 isoform X2 [Hyalella azteca]|nr:uncharacterized protein LOC108677664 isoform X2 [Hyalella azteca]